MATDGLLSPGDVRSIVAELALRPSKRRGQNFVIDQNTIRRIVRLAELGVDDVVLEVGPGLGSLTIGLLGSGAPVTVVEIDRRMAERLPQTVAARRPELSPHLSVIAADALRVPLPIRAAGRDIRPTVMVANLPYNTAVPILLRVLAEEPTIARAVVMVQAEVADRLTAGPGSGAYGAPSAKLRWFGVARSAGSVPATVFWPVPKVGSKLVRFDRGGPPTDAPSREAVFECLDAAFAQRRKTIRQALLRWAGGRDALAEILASARVDPANRAEVLSIDDFGRIAASRVALAGT